MTVTVRDIRLTACFVCVLTCALAAQGQTFTVIHSFTGGGDGANPAAGLTLDHGTLYGTASTGGNGNCGNRTCGGTVFRLQLRNGNWIFSRLYAFSGPDGLEPMGPVSFGPDGTLYGTTMIGQGDYCSCGDVFNLRPSASLPATPETPWSETVIHQFSASPGEGIDPTGALVFDGAGNLYGTTEYGGMWNHCGGGLGCGTVYKLSPSSQGWVESNYGFPSGDYYPLSGVVMDPQGNLYGTLSEGDFNDGLVFELTPSGSSWTQNNLYEFTGGADGGYPTAGVIRDGAGNLYGATEYGGTGGGGTVFELSHTDGTWTETPLYSFSSGKGPVANLTMDAAGNLYGTTLGGGAYSEGNVFKLTPGNGGWTYTSLHDFTGGSDGAAPQGTLVIDSAGNVYGTAYSGGLSGANCRSYFCGVIFQITQ